VGYLQFLHTDYRSSFLDVNVADIISLVDMGLSAPSVPTYTDWTVDEVCDWLGSLGLGKCASVFRSHDIDGAELMQLNRNVLETELGIST